jgi:YD repeat-containing protein
VLEPYNYTWGFKYQNCRFRPKDEEYIQHWSYDEYGGGSIKVRNEYYVTGISCLKAIPFTQSSALISLSGGAHTKALPAGPSLLQTAKVMQGAVPAIGKHVSITTDGGSSISGITDSVGNFNFRYVPFSLKGGRETISATCSDCVNTAKKIIVVDAPETCEAPRGNPILAASGQKFQVENDWTDSSPHPLSIERFHRSSGIIPVGFGNAWTHYFTSKVENFPGVKIIRLGDGTNVTFRKDASNTWSAESSQDTLVALSWDWLYTRNIDGSQWLIDSYGKLKSIKNRNGWIYNLSYDEDLNLISVKNAFDRIIYFAYDSGRITKIILPSGNFISYGYNQKNQLNSVAFGGDSKRYLYADSRWPNALTGIANENDENYANFTFDNFGRAISTSHANGAYGFNFNYSDNESSASGRLVAGTGDDLNWYSLGVSVNHPGGANELLTFRGGDGEVRLGNISAAISEHVSSRNFVPGTSLPAAETDFLGTTTSYAWDTARRLPTAVTEAAGKPEQRTTSTTWHPQWRLPLTVTESGRVTNYTYDTVGNTLSQTITDTSVTPAQSRTWAWTYHPSGLVATETTPSGAVTSYAYDSAGNLTNATNALGHVDTYTHDAAGRVLTHTAPTGLVNTYTYDARGRMLTTNRGGLLTTFTYRPSGQVATTRTPAGYQVTYSYDAAQRLTGWSDNRSASASYTLDGMGNRVNESVLDAQGQAVWAVARTINSLNRVESITMGSAATATPSSTSYGYDANGERTSETQTVAGTTRTTSLGLDALRRVKTITITSAQNASAALVYNAQDAVTQATDFKSVATNYTRDALGNAKQEATPDSGTLTSTYDSLGLPQSITDALGRATSITRDAQGRPTQITSTLGGANQTSVLRYDLPGADYNAPGTPQASIGYLSETQDPGATTRYQRDQQGRVVRKVQALANGDTRSTAYSYVSAANGGAPTNTTPQAS